MRWFAGFALLLGLTLGLSTVPSFDVVGPDVLPQPLAWQLHGWGDASATLGAAGPVLITGEGSEDRAKAGLRVPPTEAADRWLLVGEVAVTGRGEWAKLIAHGARGEARFWSGSGRIYSPSPSVVQLRINGTFPQGATVAAVVKGPHGHMEVHGLRLFPVRVRWWWQGLAFTLSGAWLLAAGVGLRRVLRRGGGAPLVLLAGCLLGVGIALPGPWVEHLIGPMDQLQVLGWPLSLFVRKVLGHFGLFALIGAGLTRALSPGRALTLAALFAVATEALQLLAVQRTGSLHDVGLDLCGALLGVAIAHNLPTKAPHVSPP